MAYCHECGSEVADIDVFCPYCGITLQPLDVEQNNDVSFSETAVNSSTEKNKFAGNEAASTSAKKAVEQDYHPTPSNLINEFTEKEENYIISDTTGSNSLKKTSDNLNMKTESVEIPAEMLENEGISFEVTPARSEYEEKSDAVKQESQIEENVSEGRTDLINQAEKNPEIQAPAADVSSKEIAEEDNFAEASEVFNESANKNIEVSEVDATPTAEYGNEIAESDLTDMSQPEIETPKTPEVLSNSTEVEKAPRLVEEKPFEDSEPDFTATIPYTPENISKQREKISQELAPREKVEDGSKSLSKTETASETGNENAFVKPDEPLENLESESQGPRFDSVKVVEEESSRADEIEQKLIQAESINESVKSEKKEGRSYTTPNIGGNDTDGASKSKLKPLDEGTILNGRYEIVRKIGGGGMGAVYLASDKNLGGVLRAVKEMVQSYIEGAQQEKAINDFKRESLLLTTLEHQAIPTIYDYFYDDKEGRFYLVMKYISGGDLAGRLRSAPEGRLDEKSITEWAVQIADVLDYLHNHEPPIVYRDLKPANIMIDGNSGRVMLIDFGIARWINKEEKGVTAVGTMGYAPPELFSGNVEPSSDIYSLGSTMFHLLTGADPQSNPLLIFDFQKNPRPRQINPQLSDQMEKILMKSVEYNANMRFTSASEMRQALEEHLRNLLAGKVTYGVTQSPSSVGFSDQTVFCGFCGQKIVASDVFCAFCGSQQPIAQPGVQSGGYVAPVKTVKLFVLSTTDLDMPAFTLEKEENLVGRRDPMSNIFPEVDLSKFDPQTKISRRHARIWRDGINFMVEDLGSSNGTILLPAINDSIRLLPHQPHVLNNGDKLKLGDTMLHFVVG